MCVCVCVYHNEKFQIKNIKTYYIRYLVHSCKAVNVNDNEKY